MNRFSANGLPNPLTEACAAGTRVPAYLEMVGDLQEDFARLSADGFSKLATSVAAIRLHPN